MLLDDALRLGQRLYRASLPDFEREFASGIAQIREEAAHAGTLSSSATVEITFARCAQEVKRRVKAAWEYCRGAVEAGQVSPSADLGDRLRDCVRATTEDLLRQQELRIPEGYSGSPLNIEAPYREVLDFVDAEIELFVQRFADVPDRGVPLENPSVFISHIAEDATVASALKALIIASCGKDVRVFVASDYESIRSGAEWHGVILGAIKGATALIAVLSEDSHRRPWINYEVGAGDIQDKLVVPAVIRGFGKGQLRPPLARRQARSLQDPREVRALVTDIGRHLGRGDGEGNVPVDEALVSAVTIEASKPATESAVFLRFKLGDPGEPILEGFFNDPQNYGFPVEYERTSPFKNERTTIRVRLRDRQAFNRDPGHVQALVRWLAERRVLEHFAKGADAPPAVVDATDAEVEMFFRDVDPQKVNRERERWIDIPRR